LLREVLIDDQGVLTEANREGFFVGEKGVGEKGAFRRTRNLKTSKSMRNLKSSYGKLTWGISFSRSTFPDETAGQSVYL